MTLYRYFTDPATIAGQLDSVTTVFPQAARDLIDASARRDIAGNRLVLIAPTSGNTTPLDLTPGPVKEWAIRLFGTSDKLFLTVAVVVIFDVTLLRYAYISFFCLLAGLATIHLAWIILTNKCAEECPELFGHAAPGRV